jgi:hypothetical protein
LAELTATPGTTRSQSAPIAVFNAAIFWRPQAESICGCRITASRPVPRSVAARGGVPFHLTRYSPPTVPRPPVTKYKLPSGATSRSLILRESPSTKTARLAA